jgi:radical SAM superfamily enzyme YgiQ (UPF0313 family)
MHGDGLFTDLASTRLCTSDEQVEMYVNGYDMLLMNVRSYTYPNAVNAAKLFKKRNPHGVVLVGGMHARVDPDGMAEVKEFDHICKGNGEEVICELVRNPDAFDRIFEPPKPGKMSDWPRIDRTLWPQERLGPNRRHTWPLEADVGWGPPPVATLITSRVCPWRCAFCNEQSYIEPMERRPVDMVIDDINDIDARYGPIGSVVFHDSMFFQQPQWLEEFIEKYPKKARKIWPYWAAARADTVRRWPELFERLVRETNWTVVSIGFEAGTDRSLKILNKECTAADNKFSIDLLNSIGDDLEAEGRMRPRFWANIIFGIPGETQEDAIETMRMVQTMNNPIVTPATYAPFSGSLLGAQIQAEGKSYLGESEQRNAGGRYMEGVDYDFYADLMGGAYALDTEEFPWNPGNGSSNGNSKFFVFNLHNGKKRIGYGRTKAEALEIMSYRMKPEEMAAIMPDEPVVIKQTQIQEYVKELG